MDILQRATQLLAPFMGEDRRDTWLTLAFHEHRGVYDAIQKTGATADFTVLCVSRLLDRGCLGSRHALSLLLDVVRSEAGDDKQGAFQALIDELDRRCVASGVVSESAQPEDALTGYRRSLLHDLAQRYQIDTRFVRLRLLDMVRSEHALQFKEQTKDYTDLREVLADIPERAMVLLGAPGCGKSALLRRLQLDDAQDRLADRGERVSLFVSLGAYPLDKDPTKDAPRPLDWLNAQWRRQAPNLADLETLLRGQRVLLLLDALNEMPHRDASDFRERVEKWRCFLRDDFAPGNQAVFSCRSLDYSEPLSVKDDLDVRQVRVQPLTPEQIEAFLRLCAADHADSAWDEIRDDRRLLELYSTPYFLKLLTDQLEYDPRVANERAALFTGFVRRALEREIAGRNPLFMQDGVLDTRDRERINQRTWADAYDLPRRGPLILRLEALAYAMQEQVGSDGKQVMVPLDDGLRLLDHPRAQDLLKAAEQLAVLDEERKTDHVRFFHQLLQEYFAARQLRQQPAEAARLTATEWRADRIKPSLADQIATLQDFEPLPPPDPTGWEETAVLAASMAADPDGFVLGLVEASLALAGRCAAALSATNRAKPNTVAELQRRLIARSRDPDADLRARIAAAYALGELGDPRFERKLGPEGNEYLLPPLVPVEAGTYPIGSDEGLYDNEAPVHPVELAVFAIGQFPVTNAEWRCFMEAGGYEDERWWETEAAKRWRGGEGTAEGPKQEWREFRQSLQGNPERIRQLLSEGRITYTQSNDWEYYRSVTDAEFEGMLERWYRSGRQTKPGFWNDPAFNQPGQPVVGICWHEARAYCAWLSHQSGQSYRLLTEAEWEAAARGREGRAYPWPGEFDSARCNTFESHVRGTTPVGVFPGGDTPEGLADMAGNVWDWTSTAYYPYPYTADPEREDPEAPGVRRVVRGGSWDYGRGVARASYRDDYRPDFRDDGLGFRLGLCLPHHLNCWSLKSLITVSLIYGFSEAPRSGVLGARSAFAGKMGRR